MGLPTRLNLPDPRKVNSFTPEQRTFLLALEENIQRLVAEIRDREKGIPTSNTILTLAGSGSWRLYVDDSDVCHLEHLEAGTWVEKDSWT